MNSILLKLETKKTEAKYLSAIRELPASSEMLERPFDEHFNRLVA